MAVEDGCAGERTVGDGVGYNGIGDYVGAEGLSFGGVGEGAEDEEGDECGEAMQGCGC